jgi:lysozyme family protein
MRRMESAVFGPKPKTTKPAPEHAIWHECDFSHILAADGSSIRSDHRDGWVRSAAQMTALEQALTFVLRWEGSYANHPADRVGATMKGITQRVYDRYRTLSGLGTQAVKLILDDEVRETYQQQYWNAGNCRRLRGKLDLAHFETVVNIGINRATRILQESSGCTADGTSGPMTLAAVGSCELRPALEHCCEIREGWYRNRTMEKPDQKVFLKGWLNCMKALQEELGVAPDTSAEGASYGDLDGAPDTEFSPHIPDLAPGQPLEARR